jgi:hypothetical protein
VVKLNWTKIRNEYINGHISYRKLAEKHGISESNLMARAAKEKWFDKRKERRSKIDAKTEQKTVEKIAEQESDLAANIHSAANELLKKINIAIQQTDLYIEKTKVKAPTKVRDETGRLIPAFMEKESVDLKQKDGINLNSVKQIASALKDLQALQMNGKEEPNGDNKPKINITIRAATPEDMEGDEE